MMVSSIIKVIGMIFSLLLAGISIFQIWCAGPRSSDPYFPLTSICLLIIAICLEIICVKELFFPLRDNYYALLNDPWFWE